MEATQRDRHGREGTPELAAALPSLFIPLAPLRPGRPYGGK